MPIDGRTQLAFLLGCPVAHSLSPVMHQAAFQAAGLNAAYLPWSVAPARLPDAVRGLRAFDNLLGANVTIPHKQAVVALLDSLTAEAEAMGAVNTLIRRQGSLVGDNTDGAGFLMSLKDMLSVELGDLVVTVLGAGGAARAVAITLARAGVRRLRIMNRTQAGARRLAEMVTQRVSGCEVVALPLHADGGVDAGSELHLLVNTTSIGLHPSDPPLFDYQRLEPPAVVYDLIYRPAETPLLAAARRNGCQTLNGLGMLLYQGSLAFEQWTGRPAPIHAMRQALGLE